jgi:cold shock CspA family protein
MRGRMIWFNAEKGYGFIRTEDDERLYIHESGFADGHVPTGRCAGT